MKNKRKAPLNISEGEDFELQGMTYIKFIRIYSLIDELLII